MAADENTLNNAISEHDANGEEKGRDCTRMD